MLRDMFLHFTRKAAYVRVQWKVALTIRGTTPVQFVNHFDIDER